VRAARCIAEDVAAGRLAPEAVDEAAITARLFTAGVPDPDLLIRTSGEMRISNFLLWQLAYTELHISPVLWPDFGRAELFRAILDYQSRDRRFGRVSA
jgi:undecaprenyl diphosphate synthase